MKLVRCLISVVLLAFTIACAQKEPQKVSTTASPSPSATAENYPNLTAKAKEITDALANKDYVKVLDLIYPKVIEKGGGREKMSATMKDEIKQMETEGVAVLSAIPGTPTQFVHESGAIYAVVPVTVKMKAQNGTFQMDATLIGISSDAGASWTLH